jgi:putative MATE family efflux protein
MSPPRSTTAPNPYLHNSIAGMFLKTALPIIALTSVNGLLTVVDAIFLGTFVGPEALTAVTLMFPVVMLVAAIATMISTGMSSLLGRLIGAGKLDQARRTFVGAHGLALGSCAVLMLNFATLGWAIVDIVAGGSLSIAEMGHTFLSVSIFTAPVAFFLSIHSDALRIEGRVGFMAVTGILVSLLNMAFNYGLIVWLHLGVAGSAIGTALAQLVALVIIVGYRASGQAPLPLALTDWRYARTNWGGILSLGAPRSLTFIGISLGAAATITSLRLFGAHDTDATIAAYGVIMRLMTFAFFPLMGMSLALQAMVANNFGAGQWARVNASLTFALGLSFAYALSLEVGLVVFRDAVAGLFVSDPMVQAEVARILPIFMGLYFTFGPMMMVSSYFQSIGDAKRAAILALSRTYLFAVPLTFALPLVFGVDSIWFAAPAADVALLLVMAGLLAGQSRTASTRRLSSA